MTEIKPEFNLIDEPWIRVMDNDCRISEVSLADVIINAHKYKALSGELPTQDIAVMRLILAVLHTVFSRVDENGKEDETEDKNKQWAVKRWNALWNRKSFSEKAITEYLEKWHERFWLFHPDRPFFQVAGLKNGTDYAASKLNGEISESNNKLRIFSAYSGSKKNNLTFSQATRWLLYLNGYDDNNVAKHRNPEIIKGDKSNIKKSGLGYLGKLGLIYLVGENLFETLMLNLVMISNGEVQFNQKPIWENESISSKENNEIPIPKNMAELYTLQSRRILLEKDKDNAYVIGFNIYGGDFFDTSNYYYEPMTTWCKNKKNSVKEEYFTKLHDQSKQMWREFSVIYTEDNDNRKAGIIEWYIGILYCNFLKKATVMRTAITSVKYDIKQCSIENIMFDSLEMYSSILLDIGRDWRKTVEDEIKKCEDLASAIYTFGKNLYIASGGSDNEGSDAGNTAKEQLYYRLDIPFRKWLRSIDADESDREERLKVWRDVAKKIAVGYARELAAQCSETAVVGHFVQGTEKKSPAMYSVPKAMNIFLGSIKKIYG